MASGYKDFTSGAVLAAADLEDYCELQGIMRFASAAARATALAGVLTEGLMCYLVDLNVIQVYSGSAWSTIGPVHGALTSWTPAITQSGGVACTVNVGWYQRNGRAVTAAFSLAVTGTGTASNIVTVSLPVTSIAGTDTVLGTAFLTDTSATLFYPTIATLASTTTMRFYLTIGGAPNNLLLGSGSSSFTAALASGDTLSGCITYQAAADA